LFDAVLEAVEADIARRLAEAAAAKAASDPVEAARQAMRTWLEICVEPEIYRIALIDGPSVVGWAHWREVCQRHVFGLTESLLERGIQLGHIREQPVRPLAHVVMGASDEAALYVAESADPVRARIEMLAALDRLIDGISALRRKANAVTTAITATPCDLHGCCPGTARRPGILSPRVFAVARVPGRHHA
jgi:hypothetical protein